MARTDVTSPSASAGHALRVKSCEGEPERGKGDQNDVPPRDRTLLGVDDPEVDDQVNHAPCGGGRGKDASQHGTIMSLGFRTNQRLSQNGNRLLNGDQQSCIAHALASGSWSGCPYRWVG